MVSIPVEREPPVPAPQTVPSSKPTALTFQELLFRLQSFWAERGCILQQPFDVEVGAGTMAPETFLTRTFYAPESLVEWMEKEASRAGLSLSAYIRSTFTRTRERQEAAKP